MGRYTKRAFQLGEWYLGQRNGSPAWYRCRYSAGRVERISLGTADFEQAKQILTDWFVGQQKLTDVPQSALTMAQVLLRYWEERGKNAVRAATVRGHCNHWIDHFGDKTVVEATSFTEQEAFKTALLSRGLAPMTVNHITSTGRAALRMAWKQGALSSVPPLTMLPVGDQEPMGRPVSIEEAAKLLNELPPHLWLLNVILIGTVARPSAVLDLDWSQIDFENGLVSLNRPGRTQNKKRRPVVKLPTFLREILEPMAGEGPVITFEGERVKSVKTSWRKARERAKLDPGVTLYSWRHTLGRWMRAKGVPQWEVQGQLGHRVAGVTERYAEYAPDYLAKATEAIELFYREVSGYNKTANVGLAVQSSNESEVRGLRQRYAPKVLEQSKH